MKSLLLLGAILLAGAIMPTSAVKENVREELDARIIVQLDGSPLALSQEVVRAQQNSVLRNINNLITKDYEIVDRFSTLINGVVLKVNSSRVASIRNIPGVKNVEYDNVVIAQPQNSDELVSKELSIHVSQDKKNISKETVKIPEGTKRGEGTTIAILDTGALLNATYTDAEGVTHTGVTHNTFTDLDQSIDVKFTQQGIQDKIQAYEATGKTFHGKKDATHSTYWNRKVPFYYNYGGITHDENDPGTPGYNVYQKGEDHGTHVASIAAGNDPHYRGLAYNAQVLVMNVFTTFIQKGDETGASAVSLGAFDSSIAAALEDCYALGVDVVSLSLGSDLIDWSERETSMDIIDALSNAGTYVNFAGGNNGKDAFDNTVYEYWTPDMVETGMLGPYATHSTNMSVAACQADEEYYESALVVDGHTIAYEDQVVNYNSTDGEVVYEPERKLIDLLNGQPSATLEWVKIPNWGQAKDYAGIDAKGKVAVCDRGGEITFVEKITSAQDNGAIGCVVIDNDASNTSFNSRMALQNDDGTTWTPNIPVIYSLFKDKAVWDNATNFELSILSKTETNNPNARTMATFSSDGPTYNLQIKPEISAPGQCILGAITEDDDGYPCTDIYEYFDGTSMATPNYSGAVAVLLAEIEDKTTANNRYMSTATPMKDRFGKNYESVRRQGAGLINVENAINSKAFLDGSTTDDDSLTGKAKIELGNNPDIAKGDVKLSFKGVNQSSENITYTATTYVLRPDLIELDPEFYPDFVGKKLQATYDHLIGTASQTVTLNANSSTVINLDPYSIPSSEIKQINDNFENGCYIEGFVILTAEGKETLSIPFLGFYGDLSKVSPVEPFEFEKNPDKVYPSDLTNYLINKNIGLHGDYSSDWVYCNAPDMGEIDLESWLLNEKSLRDLSYIVDSKVQKYTPIGYDPLTKKVDPNKLAVGNNGMANTMIIAQYVTRSVATNNLTLTKKSSGEVVLRDHMFDSLYGATQDDNGNDIAWPLTKSHIRADLLSNSLIAHRAYTIIPLYEYEDIYHEDTGEYEYIIGEQYESGEYEIKFEYECLEGSRYEMKYDIIIDNSKPTIKRFETVDKNGEIYTRCYVESTSLSFITVNGYQQQVVTDDQGNQYYDVKNSSLANDLIFVKATTFNNCVCGSLTHASDINNLSLENVNLNSTIDFTTEINKDKEGEFYIDISFVKSKKSYELKGQTKVTFKKFEEIGEGPIHVYVDKGSKNYEEISFVDENGYLSFFTEGSYSFKLTFTQKTNPDPGPTPGPDPEPKKGCGGSLIISGSTACALALTGLVLILKRKKED